MCALLLESWGQLAETESETHAAMPGSQGMESYHPPAYNETLILMQF